jgi:hypothetical protein
VFVSDHIGLVEGFASGAAHMATGTASLALAASDLVNPVTWALDGQRNTDHVVNAYRAVDAVDSIVDPNRWMTNPRQSLNNAKVILAGLTKEYQKDFANGDVPKLAGRGGFEFLSAAGPLLLGKVGRLETLAKVGAEASAETQVVRDAAAAESRLDPDVAGGASRGGAPTADAGPADSGVQSVGGRAPINSRYAGQTYPIGSLPRELQVKYPNSVKFTARGFPDFSPYKVAEVRLEGLSGNYGNDAALANKAVGIKSTPQGYVWHHVEDGETMQLIPQDLHNAVRHTGGSAVIRYDE